MKKNKTVVGVFYNQGKLIYIYETVKETVKNDFYLRLAKLVITNLQPTQPTKNEIKGGKES